MIDPGIFRSADGRVIEGSLVRRRRVPLVNVVIRSFVLALFLFVCRDECCDPSVGAAVIDPLYRYRFVMFGTFLDVNAARIMLCVQRFAPVEAETVRRRGIAGDGSAKIATTRLEAMFRTGWRGGAGCHFE